MAPAASGGGRGSNERAPLLPGGGSSATISNNSPFGVHTEQLTAMLDPKDPEKLQELGGPDQVCKSLLVNPQVGLKQREQLGSSEQQPFQIRREVFGRNILPEADAVTFWQLLVAAYNDRTLSKYSLFFSHTEFYIVTVFPLLIS